MREQFSTEEETLLQLLQCAMSGKPDIGQIPINQADCRKLVEIAGRHAVLSLLAQVNLEGLFEKQEMDRIMTEARQTVQKSYHLLFCSRYVLQRLLDHGIQAVLLKGAATASCYPTPELRKSGDVDIMLTCPTDIDRACEILEQDGFTMKEEQHANHHRVLVSPDQIDVEIHTMLAEPFDDRTANRYLQTLQQELGACSGIENVMGIELPVLRDGYHAFELLLHMLQHFLRAGFGLKLLCDWVCFWNRPVAKEEIRCYLRLIREIGLTDFSDMITSLCVHYLGLQGRKEGGIRMEEDQILYDGGLFGMLLPQKICSEYMKEILAAEEFGHSSSERMVMLRGTAPADYFREFHHQMQLNYPRAQSCVICWPVLWVMTLCRFLVNNRKIRKTSSLKILKTAGNRSRMMSQLHLFHVR
ncbi:MAG: nucleotidyltransferase family protein [Lachnospiraceae bacterium]|nr:nucleotidyltransferase family protein [Lachnospiraceae bacterium]